VHQPSAAFARRLDARCWAATSVRSVGDQSRGTDQNSLQVDRCMRRHTRRMGTKPSVLVMRRAVHPGSVQGFSAAMRNISSVKR